MRKLVFMPGLLLGLLIIFSIAFANSVSSKTDVNDSVVNVLPKKRLTDHLLMPNDDWIRYYDTPPSEQIQLYYNIAVLIDVVRQHESRIKNLTERIEILEKASAVLLRKNEAAEGPGSAAPDSNAASASAKSEGPVRKATEQ